MSIQEESNSIGNLQGESGSPADGPEKRKRWHDVIFAPIREVDKLHQNSLTAVPSPGDERSETHGDVGSTAPTLSQYESSAGYDVQESTPESDLRQESADLPEAYQSAPPPLSSRSLGQSPEGDESVSLDIVGARSAPAPAPAVAPDYTQSEGPLTQGDEVGATSASILATQQIESATNSTIVGVQVSYFIDPSAEREIPSEVLRSARSVFVETEAFGVATRSFDEGENIVVLAGPPGSGRKSTALALMADLHAKNNNRIAVLPYGGSPDYSTRQIPKDGGGGYILELPSDDAADDFKVAPRFGALLGSINRILKERGSRLVVVTTSEQWKRIGFDSPCDAYGVEPANGLSIVGKRLTKEHGTEVSDQWTRHPAIVSLLEAEDPWGSVEILDLIRRTIYEPAPPLTRADRLAFGLGEDSDESEFGRRVLSVVSARRSWRSQLLSWHKERKRTSFHRNFLLASATLREAPIADLHQGAIDLCAEFKEEGVSQLRGQQSPGVIELVDEIGAELTAQDTIRFRRPGWPEAAIEYFWLDRPLNRDNFIQWAAAAVLKSVASTSARESAELSLARANSIAAFVVTWSLRHNQPMLLQQLVEKWHKTLAWHAAVEAVTGACFDQHAGRTVHRLLLTWSKSDQTPLQAAVAEVCAGSFGRAYPGKALVRLRHLASAASGETLPAVKDAVQGLWKDLTVRPALTAEVAAWCLSDEMRRKRSGRFAFTALAEMKDSAGTPLLLWEATSNPSGDVAQLVTAGWRAILAADDDKEAQVAVTRAWVGVAASNPLFTEGVIELFLQVVAASRAASFNLQELMYLSFEGPDRERFKPFRQKIHDLDLAQKKSLAVQAISSQRFQDHSENR